MFSPWYLCMYCPVLCLSLVDMILFDMRYVGRFRNMRHIWLAAVFVRRHLECRPYLIPGSKDIWNLLSLLCVKLLSWILYLIRITVLLCVIGDRYKKSNHLECRPYLIPGSKVIWNLLSLLRVKLLSWILYLIRITVLLCVIGDRYKKSNH